MGVQSIESQEDFQKALKDAGSKLVVADFYATWCGPCKMIAPKIEQWANGDFKDVCFVKVDVDENTEVSEAYEISAMPTFVLFKDGKVIEKVVGASTEKLKEAIEKHK